MVSYFLRKSRRFIILLICIFIMSHSTIAQTISTPVDCGTILEAELSPENDTHNYTIHLTPGDTLAVEVEPIGQILELRLRIYDPQGERLSDNWASSRGSSVDRSIVVSATGGYRIETYAWHGSDVGAYTLFVGCTLRDGTVIAPGDTIVQNTNAADNPPSTISAPAFGFAGLAPVDFSNVARIPLTVDIPMTGAITPTGGEILGYVMNSNAGDVLELSYTRLSGNLNLGIVVISESNELVFQASLITSSTLTTRFVFPSSAEYTIGIFRVDLLPPATPEPTAFQIQAVLNP